VRLQGAARPPASPVPRSLLDAAETLPDALSELARRYPEFRCLVIADRRGGERSVALGELWKRARVVQAHLVAAGLSPGDVVLLSLPTGAELVSAYFGVLLAGGAPGLIATPSNRVADPSVYAERVGAILRDARAHTFYAAPEVAAIFGGEGAAHLVAAAPAVPVAPAAPRDVATVQYSSGSTGQPKGILLTHEAMLNNIRAVRDGLGLGADDVSVNWIPLYHDMGLIDAFLLPLFTGCPTVLIPTMDFMTDPALWLWAMHRYEGAISWAPNFAYSVCARRVPDADLAGLDLSRWRIAINAAEPLLAPTLDAFVERFAAHGFRPEAMTPAWGLAENVTIATAHPVGERPRVETVDRQALATEEVARPAPDGIPSVAIGRCLPHCEVEIRGEDGTPLPDRRVGAVWLRSNSLFDSYLGDPETTARVRVAGWLDTGDQGYVDGGDLFFVSRDKDLIVIGGEKYAPHDVETIINRVPGVRQGCAVAFGLLDELRGTEDLAAVVETRAAGYEATALDTAIRDAVLRTTGLSLRHLVLVPPGGVEKTTSGKLARRATRARHAEALRA